MVRVMVRVTVRCSLVAIRMSSDDGCAAWSIAFGLNACNRSTCQQSTVSGLPHGRQDVVVEVLMFLKLAVVHQRQPRSAKALCRRHRLEP